MKTEEMQYANKPKDWPSNAIESRLDNIDEQLQKFKEDPSYQNKEILISLVSDYDLNQHSMLGMLRTTEYEVALINSLYIESLFLQVNSLKSYLYELIGLKTRMQKMASWFPEGLVSLEIEEFQGLMMQLKIYYMSYHAFTIDKDLSFGEKIIETLEEILDYSKENDSAEDYIEKVSFVTNGYISMLNDLSYFRCRKRTSIWTFTHEELYKLFKLAGELTTLNGDLPYERPLKGVLMTCISNYILKSRNNYNEDYICKYISPEIVNMSVENHEIWMSKIESLNDDREQRVIPELFDEEGWLQNEWVQNVDFSPKRTYYVSSFCKSLNDEDMLKDYGSCIYGYKDDRMADILAPIMYFKRKDGTKRPVFSHVVAFDVIYNRDEAKEEIIFLCKIINCFSMTDTDKNKFLEEIMQYWLLSVKDKKWSHERERRYVLFLYNDYEYRGLDISDSRFLKLKTSLFLHPDFILGDNPVKNQLKVMADDKRQAISLKPYLYCADCLNRDFDIVAGGNRNVKNCSICGSEKVSFEVPKERRI